MKEKLIKYIMERADKYYSDDFPICCIEDWINEFFDQYQPERLSPEDTYVPLNDYEGNEDQWKKCWLGVCDSSEHCE